MILLNSSTSLSVIVEYGPRFKLGLRALVSST